MADSLFTLYQDALTPYADEVKKRFGQKGYSEILATLRAEDAKSQTQYATFRKSFDATAEDPTTTLVEGHKSLDALDSPVAKILAVRDLRQKAQEIGAPPDALKSVKAADALTLSEGQRKYLASNADAASAYDAFARRVAAFTTVAASAESFSQSLNKRETYLARYAGDPAPTIEQSREKVQGFLQGAWDKIKEQKAALPPLPPSETAGKGFDVLAATPAGGPRPADIPKTASARIWNGFLSGIGKFENLYLGPKEAAARQQITTPGAEPEKSKFLFPSNPEGWLSMAGQTALMGPAWGKAEAAAATVAEKTALTGVAKAAVQHALAGAGIGFLNPAIPISDVKGRLASTGVTAALAPVVGVPLGLAGGAIASRFAKAPTPEPMAPMPKFTPSFGPEIVALGKDLMAKGLIPPETPKLLPETVPIAQPARMPRPGEYVGPEPSRTVPVQPFREPPAPEMPPPVPLPKGPKARASARPKATKAASPGFVPPPPRVVETPIVQQSSPMTTAPVMGRTEAGAATLSPPGGAASAVPAASAAPATTAEVSAANSSWLSRSRAHGQTAEDIPLEMPLAAPAEAPPLPTGVSPIEHPGPPTGYGREAIAHLNDAVGHAITMARQRSSRLGVHFPSTGVTQIRPGTNVRVAFHEAVHDLASSVPDFLDQKAIGELQALPASFRQTIPDGASPLVQAHELMAEFGAQLAYDPATAKLAPYTAARFESLVGKKGWDAFQAASKLARQVEGSPPLLQPLAAMVNPETLKPGGPAAAIRRFFSSGPQLPFGPLRRTAGGLFSAKTEPLRAAEALAEKTLGKRPVGMASPLRWQEGLYGTARAAEVQVDSGLRMTPTSYATDVQTGAVLKKDWVTEPLADAVALPQATVKDPGLAMDVMDAVLVSQRALQGRFAGKDVTGAGLGAMPSATRHLNALRDYGKMPASERALYDEAARRWRSFADGLLRMAVKNGRVSQDSYNWLQENDPFYATFARMLELTPHQAKSLPGDIASLYAGGPVTSEEVARGAAAFKKIGESQRPIIGPYRLLVQRAATTINDVWANNRNRALADIALSLGRESWRVGQKAEDGQTIVYRNGVPERWNFDPFIAKALEATPEMKFPGLASILLWPRSIITRMVVTHPRFAFFRNPARDLPEALAKSKSSSTWSLGLLPKKAYLSVTGVSASVREEALAAGAGQFGWYMDHPAKWSDALSESLKRQVAQRGVKVINPFWLAKSTIHKFFEAEANPEMKPRLAEYQRIKEELMAKGMPEDDAVLESMGISRELMDFKEGGSWVEFLNRTSPFFKAGMAATQPLVRNFFSPRMQARMAVYGLTAAALEEWHALRSGHEEDLHNLPSSDRDFFLSFFYGNEGKRFIVPMAWTPGIFRAVGRRLLDYARTNDANTFADLPKNLVRLALPVPDLDMISQLRANYAVMRNQAIVWDPELDPKLRPGAYRATDVGKVLNKVLGGPAKVLEPFGFTIDDPRQWDFIVQNMGGYYGQDLRTLADALNGKMTWPQAAAEVMGATRRIPVRGQPVLRLYEMANRYGFDNRREFKRVKDRLSAAYDLPDGRQKLLLTRDLNRTASDILRRWRKEVEAPGYIEQRAAKVQKKVGG